MYEYVYVYVVVAVVVLLVAVVVIGSLGEQRALGCEHPIIAECVLAHYHRYCCCRHRRCCRRRCKCLIATRTLCYTSRERILPVGFSWPAHPCVCSFPLELPDLPRARTYTHTHTHSSRSSFALALWQLWRANQRLRRTSGRVQMHTLRSRLAAHLITRARTHTHTSKHVTRCIGASGKTEKIP